MTKNQDQKKIIPAKLNYGKPSKDGKAAVSFHAQSDRDQVLAMVNPFSAAAKGARLPDDDSSFSVGVQLKTRVFLNTDANGRGAIHIAPNLAGSWTLATAMTDNEVTTWGTTQPIAGYTTYADATNAFRIVSWGVRMVPVASPLDQSGVVYVVTTGEAANVANYDFASPFHVETRTFSCADESVHWISKPMGNAWKRYVAWNATPDYDRLVVAIVGGPATKTMFQIEIVYNVEIVPNIASFTATLATQGLPHNPKALTAASHAHSKTPHSFSKLATRALDTVANWALNAAVGYFTPGFRLPKLNDKIIEVD